MKTQFIIIFFVAVLLSACNNNKNENLPGDIVNNPLTADGEVDASQMPYISFEKTEHDFGKIYEGEKVTCHFKFKNDGQSDLIITSAKGSCGCTVPEYPKEAIKPGSGGTIAVEFNSSGRKGQQAKSVTVMTNAQPPTVILAIKAMVIEP